MKGKRGKDNEPQEFSSIRQRWPVAPELAEHPPQAWKKKVKYLRRHAGLSFAKIDLRPDQNTKPFL